jgi:hypothetical protein
MPFISFYTPPRFVEAYTSRIKYVEVFSAPGFFELYTSEAKALEFYTPPIIVEFKTAKRIFLEFRVDGNGLSMVRLKPKLLSIAPDCTTVEVSLLTGEFEADPDGWTPVSGTSTLSRPKRSEVRIYTILKVYKADGSSVVYRPGGQFPDAVPYVNAFQLPDTGVAELWLVAIPLTQSVDSWAARDILTEATRLADWSYGFIPVFVDCEAAKIISAAEQDLAYNSSSGGCSDCSERIIRLARSIASAMTNGNMTKAAEYLITLKKLGSTEGCGCGC